MTSEREWQKTLAVVGVVVLILAVVVLPGAISDAVTDDPGGAVVLAAWVLVLFAVRLIIDALTAIARHVVAACRRRR